MTTQLTETAKQLITKARIVSFKTWEGVLPKEIIQLFQIADNQGRYLTEHDCRLLKAAS